MGPPGNAVSALRQSQRRVYQDHYTTTASSAPAPAARCGTMSGALAHRHDPKRTDRVEAAAQERAQRSQAARDTHKRGREHQFRNGARKTGGDTPAGGGGIVPGALAPAGAADADMGDGMTTATALVLAAAAAPAGPLPAIVPGNAAQTLTAHAHALHAGTSAGCVATIAQAMAWARARAQARGRDWTTALDVCIATRPGDSRGAALTPAAFASAIDALRDMDVVIHVGTMGSVIAVRLFALQSAWLPAAADACSHLMQLIHHVDMARLHARIAGGADAAAAAAAVPAASDPDADQRRHYVAITTAFPTLYEDAIVCMTLILRVLSDMTMQYYILRDTAPRLPAAEMPLLPTSADGSSGGTPDTGPGGGSGGALSAPAVCAADVAVQAHIEAMPTRYPDLPECIGACYHVFEGAVRARFPQLLTMMFVARERRRMMGVGAEAAGDADDDDAALSLNDAFDNLELMSALCLGNIMYHNNAAGMADIPGLAAALGTVQTANVLCDALMQPDISEQFLGEVLFCLQTLINGATPLARLLLDDDDLSRKLVHALLHTTRTVGWRLGGRAALHVLADFAELMPATVGMDTFLAVVDACARCIRTRRGLDASLLQALLAAMANNLQVMCMAPDFDRILAIFEDDATYDAIVELGTHPRSGVSSAANDLLAEIEGRGLDDEDEPYTAAAFSMRSTVPWNMGWPHVDERAEDDDDEDDDEDDEDDDDDDDEFDDDDDDDVLDSSDDDADAQQEGMAGAGAGAGHA